MWVSVGQPRSGQVMSLWSERVTGWRGDGLGSPETGG